MPADFEYDPSAADDEYIPPSILSWKSLSNSSSWKSLIHTATYIFFNSAAAFYSNIAMPAVKGVVLNALYGKNVQVDEKTNQCAGSGVHNLERVVVHGSFSPELARYRYRIYDHNGHDIYAMPGNVFHIPEPVTFMYDDRTMRFPKLDDDTWREFARRMKKHYE
jgi:hypothetical protein